MEHCVLTTWCQTSLSLAFLQVMWTPKFKDWRSSSIVLSQVVLRRPTGLLQPADDLSAVAITHWWSSSGAVRAVCPKKHSRTDLIQPITGEQAVMFRTVSLVVCLVYGIRKIFRRFLMLYQPSNVLLPCLLWQQLMACSLLLCLLERKQRIGSAQQVEVLPDERVTVRNTPAIELPFEPCRWPGSRWHQGSDLICWGMQNVAVRSVQKHPEDEDSDTWESCFTSFSFFVCPSVCQALQTSYSTCSLYSVRLSDSRAAHFCSTSWRVPSLIHSCRLVGLMPKTALAAVLC